MARIVKRKEKFDVTRLRFVLLGLLVGLLTGAVVSAFRYFIEIGLRASRHVYGNLRVEPFVWWHWVLLIAVNLILAGIVAWMLKKEPYISGSGIPQVEGQLAGELEMNWWAIFWRKFVGGVLAIAPGLFLGREGPSIQLGAAVGQGLAGGFKLRGTDRRLLIASGAAAGLAAAFNAPIAGTLFVLEEIYHNFSPLVWLTALAGAIGSNFISLNVFGLVPVLHISYSRSLPISIYWQLIILGIILGLLGYLYQRVLLAMPRWYQKLTKLPRAMQGVVPFILLIAVGYFTPNLLGGGNSLIIGFGHYVPSLLALLGIFAARFIFSMISYGSGLPGGIFLPILSLGAIIGAIYGVIMYKLGLLPHVYVMNLIIFSMAGYFAGIGKAPFTAILLVTEMVGNLTHLMPLAVLSLTAYLVVDLLGGAPIYEALLEQMTFPKTVAQLHRPDRLEIPVFVGSALNGKLVRDLPWPKEALLIGIRRGEQEVIPHGDTLIREGDTLVLLTDSAQRARVKRRIDALSAALATAHKTRV
ncbi:ClC family H(+)/Cl(-) exchange transporter [Lacticaseibacillus chiayiensis]|uniref:ClC family H(+)/Cl(-) exchange transporter n=1 Tax=Lacticaseibacillus chiayiensis TaxID=2100821 RepID=UPI001011F62B|nr:ClC family H(+)/Cl(-) exchange transporter [Lacticaseibacillus chiayiensis]RXT59446.1 ClC family H(+)/Cl(-) exchange transporter [Lacticaseibacillus chiayiensis]